jgi:hypothetical protein
MKQGPDPLHNAIRWDVRGMITRLGGPTAFQLKCDNEKFPVERTTIAAWIRRKRAPGPAIGVMLYLLAKEGPVNLPDFLSRAPKQIGLPLES